jgi:hypothetical protein
MRSCDYSLLIIIRLPLRVIWIRELMINLYSVNVDIHVSTYAVHTFIYSEFRVSEFRRSHAYQYLFTHARNNQRDNYACNRRNNIGETHNSGRSSD